MARPRNAGLYKGHIGCHMERRLRILAFVWGIPGFAIQSYGLIEGWSLVSLVGSALLCVGLMCHIRWKGYHPVWGLWGVVPVMGPILLLLQPHRPGAFLLDTLEELLVEEDPHIRAVAIQGQSTVSGGVALLVVMAPIGFLILLFSARLPQAVAPSEVAPVALSGERSPSPAPIPPNSLTSAPVASEPRESTAQAPVAPVPPTNEPHDAEKAPDAAPQTETKSAAVSSDAESASPVAAESVAPPPQSEISYEAKYKQIQLGFTYEQVCAIVGEHSVLVSGKIGGDKIVKWRNPDTSYFAARFRGNVLERMTRLSYPPPEKKLEEMAEELRSPGEGKATVEEEQVARNDSEEQSSSEVGQPSGEAETQNEEETVPAEAVRPQKEVVRVGGAQKTEPRRRKAQFPRYTQEISRGPHDVYFHNETDSSLRVAVRAPVKRGRNFNVSAGGEKAIYLPNGSYEIYYIKDDDPYELKNAGALVVDSPPATLHVPLQ